MPKKKDTKQAKTEVIKPGHADYMQPGTLKIMKMMDKGLSPEEACKLVKGKDIIHPNTKTDLKKKYDKWALTGEGMQKLAHNAVKNVLKMTPKKTKEVKQCPECKGKSKDPEQPMCDTCLGQGIVHTLLYPTHTNQLAAVAMVADRVDPVIKQTVSLSANIHAFVDFEGEAGSILGGLKSG